MNKKNWFLIIISLGLALTIYQKKDTVTATSKFKPQFQFDESLKDLKGWEDVQKNIDEQKYKEALKLVENKIIQYKNSNDEKNWTIALIYKQKLQSGLHKVETAVEDFKKAQWPEDFLSQVVLNLYYMQSLKQYYDYYSWEINQREKVVTKNEIDLKKWTQSDIFNEIQNTFIKIWSKREHLKDARFNLMSAFIQKGNYPEGIRDSIRDIVSYFYVDLTKNTSFWSSKQSNEVKRMDIQNFLSELENTKEESYLEKSTHPLKKVDYVLNDLRVWHEKQGRISSQLEAYYEKIKVLKINFRKANEKNLLEKSLGTYMKPYSKYAWWSEGMFLRAQIVSESPRETSQIEARDIAQKGFEAHPLKISGKRCEAFIKKIEAPELTLNAMKYDSSEKRSIKVTHKNWDNVHFRAYKLDPIDFLLKQKNSNSLPYGDQLWKILENRKPNFTWVSKLENRKDFKSHITYLTPQVKDKGFYVLLASSEDHFKKSNNKLIYTYYQQTDLFVLRENKLDKYRFLVTHAKNNAPISNAHVNIYELNWQKGHKLYEQLKTNNKGMANWRKKATHPRNIVYHIKSKKYGDYYTLDNTYLNHHINLSRKETRQSLVFTNRSIFRPGQKIHFKILAYKNKGSELPNGVPQDSIKVELRDSNYQVVETQSLKTNSFSTASGEFIVPKGRALGHWSIRVLDYSGQASIKVEEYKRPTFFVELNEAKEELRLNHKAEFKGVAKYYFGMPVTSARVKYTVTRQVFYPYWYYWWYPGASRQNEIIKVDEVITDEKGEFVVRFLPQANIDAVDKKIQNVKGINYQYFIEVETLNEGGETAKTSKRFTVGDIAVQANLLKASDFNTKDVNYKFTRTDLNGKPLSGKGEYQLFQLKNPKQVLEPSEYPLYLDKMAPKPGKYSLPGDYKRPRWQGFYEEGEILKSWEVSQLIQKGTLEHDENGLAKKLFSALAPGAYRVVYTTKDKWGSEFQNEDNFLMIHSESNLQLPLIFRVSKKRVFRGDEIRFFIHSAYKGQKLKFELYHGQKIILEKNIDTDKFKKWIPFKIKKNHYGTLSARIYAVRDHSFLNKQLFVSVPYVQKNLKVEFERIRKKIYPGTLQKWSIKIKAQNDQEKEISFKKQAEVLAYMYDKSLDIFTTHNHLSVIYPSPLEYFNYNVPYYDFYGSTFYSTWYPNYSIPSLTKDHLNMLSSYGIGGMGSRRGFGKSLGIGFSKSMSQKNMSASMDTFSDMESDQALAESPSQNEGKIERKLKKQAKKDSGRLERRLEEKVADKNSPLEKEGGGVNDSQTLRSNFSETSFFLPHLKTDSKGEVKLTFTVPDSLTSWNVWAHALTKDLDFGLTNTQVESVKDLMVRTYFPRFLRQGDQVELKVVISNSGQKPLKGKFYFNISKDKKDSGKEFELSSSFQKGIGFSLAPQKSKDLSVKITVPAHKLEEYTFKAYAQTKNFTDGEEKRLSILPSRVHLTESKFITLKDKEKREILFNDMLTKDPSRIHGALNVKLDTQLFYSLLSAVPYLRNDPYECTPYFLNNYVTTSILSSTYSKYPSVAQMAQKFSKRKTQLESWNADDPNRKLKLVETPWLVQSEGGGDEGLFNTLDPLVSKKVMNDSLKQLKKYQTSIGGFPWMKGGPPSVFMTIQVLKGFSRVEEFGGQIDRDMVQKAWSYIGDETRKMIDHCMSMSSCWEIITLINFTLSSYKDSSLYENYIPKSLREKMLDFSFSLWKKHSPQLKGMLALTLHREKRKEDAFLVFDSVLDSAKNDKDLGVYWAPEDRSWLWYNDTITSQAYALRVLTELKPKDQRRSGLVQWLFLNKKLNQWKSTLATSEVIYSVLYYLKSEKLIGNTQKINIQLGSIHKKFLFLPNKYTGKDNFIHIEGEKIKPKSMYKITAEQETKGISFVSANWHYSTEKLPEKAKGDFFQIKREFFKREKKNDQVELSPLKEGTTIEVGDQIEVQISIRLKHEAEYVHLRDPRPAGFEPESAISRFKWDLGVARFEEVRDSGMNFFIEKLPVGEYTLKHRIKANLKGKFRTHPAVIQSMYAPEFNAFSSGQWIKVK